MARAHGSVERQAAGPASNYTTSTWSFTLPVLAGEIAFQNKAIVYTILFRSAAETLSTIAADPQASFRTARDDRRPPHPEREPCDTIHMFAASYRAVDLRSTAHAGSPAGPVSFCRCASSHRCSALCSCKARRRVQHRQLGFFGDSRRVLADPAAFTKHLEQLRRIDSVVSAKPHVSGPEQRVAYLGPLHPSRRHRQQPARLAMRWQGQLLLEGLSAEQQSRSRCNADAEDFIQRFLLHSLGDGFHRIRRYGFLADGGRAVTSLPSAASCSLSRSALSLTNISSPILRSLKRTFPSAHVAAVACDASMSCRRPATRTAVPF